MQLFNYSLMDNVVRKRTTYCHMHEINIQTWLTSECDIEYKHQHPK